MTTFATDIWIDAPLEHVWETLADIGSIHRWNPGVVASHATSESTSGLGATRYCDLGGRNYLHESVVHFEPGEALTMRVEDTNLPFESVDIRFTLTETDAGTQVTVSPIYELKFGPMGALVDRLYVRRTYERGMAALLRGLKDHAEAIAG